MPVTTRERAVSWIVVVARMTIAGTFFWASFGKMNDLDLFAQTIDNYHVLPNGLSGYLALFIPTAEIVTAIALLVGFGSRGGALVATLMLSVFTFGIAQAWSRGIDISCGCFGSETSAEIGPIPIVRNLVLITGGILVATQKHVGWRAVFGSSPASKSVSSVSAP